MRVRAFAARIANRYRRGAIRRGIALPLAITARSAPSSVVHRHVRFGDRLQARLQMHLHLHRTLVTAAAPASREPLASALAPLRESRAEAQPVTPRIRVSIAEQLPLRGRRRETVPSSHSLVPAAPNAHADAAAAPVVRMAPPLTVVRRHESAARTPDSSIAAAHGDRSGADDARHPRTSGPGRSPRIETATVPEGEIERLTDRVIGSIDRRIAAQRERLGRF